MRAETAAYKLQRLKWATQPRLFLRFYHVPTAGSTQEWAFSRDFSSGPVLSPSVPKLPCIRRLTGNPQRVDPMNGTSEIGTMMAELGDLAGEITRYLADPALPLSAGLSTELGARFMLGGFVASSPTSADPDLSVLGDGRGYPSRGHITIDAEDIAYTAFTVGGGLTTFTGLTRGARGTTIGPHAAGALVRNGEQIRRGQRVTLFLGYVPALEADYGPAPGYVKLAVEAFESAPGGLGWVVRASDIQRFVKQSVFTSATSDHPVVLGPDHPITIALKVMTSTGTPGVNGVYDTLPLGHGAAAPQTLIAIDVLEGLRDAVLPGLQMEFREIDITDAKDFIESHLFRPLGLVPFVTQRGRYSARRLRQPLFARSGIVVRHAFRAA